MNLHEDVDILRILPSSIADDKNVQMMAQTFNDVLVDIIKDIPNLAIIPMLVRREIIDHTLLDLIAWQMHCDFYDVNFPIEKKQTLIINSIDWHSRKGTPSVVSEIVTAVFEDGEVEEWFEYGGLPYRFRVSTLFSVTDLQVIDDLVRAIYSVKNTRSWLDAITAIVKARMTLYYGIGVWFIDKLTVRTSATLRRFATAYGGIVPQIVGRLDVKAEENEPMVYGGIVPDFTMKMNILSYEASNESV